MRRTVSAIEVAHVAKRFGRHVALRDVSLDVPEGSIFGFLGPNGAGKTTTLRGCMGLTRFDAGTARLLGLDPWHDRVELHARLGFLPSGMGVYGRMTGEEMLDYTAGLGGRSSDRRQLRTRALEAVQLANADLGRSVVDYSKGMRQKLAIVQALQHRPQLLLMDEPSEGLDPLIQHAVYDLLRELRSDHGTTILFSSHTLSEVDALCDRVAIIRQGALVVESSLDELRAQRPRIVRLATADGSIPDLGDSFTHVRRDHLGRQVFETRCSADQIIAALSAVALDDVVVEEPSLEDIFRSYYGGTEG